MLEFLNRVTIRPKLVAALRRFLSDGLRQYIRSLQSEMQNPDPALTEAIFLEIALSQLHEMRNEEIDGVLASDECRQFIASVVLERRK